MAYNRNNYLLKVREVVMVAKQYYEPGRQDRNHRCVWDQHIKEAFHIGYATYLHMLKADPEYSEYFRQVKAKQRAERLAEMEERKARRTISKRPQSQVHPNSN